MFFKYPFGVFILEGGGGLGNLWCKTKHGFERTMHSVLTEERGAAGAALCRKEPLYPLDR